MLTLLRALTLLGCTTACSCDEPAKPAADATPVQAEPARAEAPKADPIVVKVCQAFDEVAAEGEADQGGMLLSRAAVRATELGVSEAQLDALGSQRPQLLASIRKRGDPPGCARFVAYLESSP